MQVHVNRSTVSPGQVVTVWLHACPSRAQVFGRGGGVGSSSKSPGVFTSHRGLGAAHDAMVALAAMPGPDKPGMFWTTRPAADAVKPDPDVAPHIRQLFAGITFLALIEYLAHDRAFLPNL